MRFLRYLLLTAVMLLTVMTVSAKGSKKQTVYMFGFSASFNDSIIYFTPVQELQGYIADNRTHFLVNRDQYSYQLKDYFENRGQLNRTCVTVYSTERKKLEKKYQKMKEKYTTKSKNKFDVVYLTDTDFKFQTVTPDEGTVYVNSEQAEANAEKSSKKHKKPKDKSNEK